MVAILAIGISVLALAFVAVFLFIFNFRFSKLSRNLSNIEETSNHKVSLLQEDVASLRTVFADLDNRIGNIYKDIEGLSRNIEANFQKLFEHLQN